MNGANLMWCQTLVRRAVCMALAVGTVALAACGGRRGMLPDSGGRPFEVVVVNDSDSIVARALGGDVAALPQAEPQFDVSDVRMRPHDVGASVLRYARSLVVVGIDSSRFSRVSVKYERNVYAEPQIIVRVSAPSVGALRSELKPQAIAGILLRHETAAAVSRLRRRGNPKMEAEVKRMFGIDMSIPADMTSAKRGRDFLWISNNSPTAMQNICVYLTDNRDSVMRANIKGETDSMYVVTTEGSVVTSDVRLRGRRVTVRRGLWEMKGDAMGGPFVSHTVSGAAGRPCVTVEAFVYAPGRKKRNLLMQAEAALWTAGMPLKSKKEKE